MRMVDAIDMRGRLTIHTVDRSGEIIQTTRNNNAIVYTGRDLVARLFLGAAGEVNPISHLAVGTGGKSVDPLNDKALQVEIFRKPLKPVEIAKDLTDIDTGATSGASQINRRIFLSADLDFTEPNSDQVATYELQEAGLFNADKGGVMYNRVVFPKISKTKDFKLTLVWEIIF
jgi:hypothetical protein